MKLVRHECGQVTAEIAFNKAWHNIKLNVVDREPIDWSIKDTEKYLKKLQELEDRITEYRINRKTNVNAKLINVCGIASVKIKNNNGITITYLNQEEGVLGPKFKFYIVNNSEYTLWVSCTNVYIDGVQADLSGGGVSDIEPGKKAYLEFTLWKSDYEKFTNYPSEVEFDIVIRDDSTWGELYSVEDLILKVK